MPAATKVTVKPRATPIVQKPAATPVAPTTVTSVAAAPVAAATDAAKADVAAAPRLSGEEVFEQSLKDAQNLVVAARGMVARVREMKKVFDRELKDSKKNTKKSRKQTGGAPRPATGFAKPTRISDALADFLRNVAGNDDVNRGDQMTRTEVTKRLNNYFIARSLRDENDKRKILYKNDAELAKLIQLPEGTQLTYFNLQTAIKDQFLK